MRTTCDKNNKNIRSKGFLCSLILGRKWESRCVKMQIVFQLNANKKSKKKKSTTRRCRWLHLSCKATEFWHMFANKIFCIYWIFFLRTFIETCSRRWERKRNESIKFVIWLSPHCFWQNFQRMQIALISFPSRMSAKSDDIIPWNKQTKCMSLRKKNHWRWLFLAFASEINSNCQRQ